MQQEIIFGVVHNAGISNKTGNKYDFRQAMGGIDAKGVGEIGSGEGFMAKNRGITKLAYEKFCASKSEFPVECKVQYGFDGKDRVVITDVEVS